LPAPRPETPLQSAEGLPDLAIDARGLRKVYRSTRRGLPAKVALDDIDLQVPRGSFFGLLGPNGAGKSTFINILAGLAVKTAGSAVVWGYDIDRQPRNARAAIGVVPQEIHFDPFFTPRESLEFQAGMYGVPKAERHTMEILEAVGLGTRAEAYVRTLSGGMKRRLMVAKALVHRPPVLVLDEPTAGVDLELRQQLWDYVRTLNRAGVTVVLTTHYLEEAEALCDRIAIINHGRVMACDTTDALLKRIDRKELVVTAGEILTAVPPTLSGFDAVLQGDRQLVVRYRPSETRAEEILAAIRAAGIAIADLSTTEADLADIFLSVTRAETGDGTD
jgi:ABC-2 type transport system ATP-binding protein